MPFASVKLVFNGEKKKSELIVFAYSANSLKETQCHFANDAHKSVANLRVFVTSWLKFFSEFDFKRIKP
jgi:hypothetical protein